MHSINTGFEKVGVMGLLPDASIIVSDQNYQNLRPTLKMYQAKTGKLLYKSFDANVPDGMAVVTAASRQYLALSYWSVKILVCELITARKRSLGQGNIFSSVCQEFCSQGGSASVHAGIPHPPEPGTSPLKQTSPLRTKHPLRGADTPSRHPPGPGTPRADTPPPAQCMLGDTVNKRAVCILKLCCFHS